MRLKPSVRHEKHFPAIISQKEGVGQGSCSRRYGLSPARGCQGTRSTLAPAVRSSRAPCCGARRVQDTSKQPPPPTALLQLGGAANPRRFPALLASLRAGPPPLPKKLRLDFLGSKRPKFCCLRTSLEMPSEATGPSFPPCTGVVCLRSPFVILAQRAHESVHRRCC